MVYTTTPKNVKDYIGNLIPLQLDGSRQWRSLEEATQECERLDELGVGFRISETSSSQDITSKIILSESV